jgi:hypothetical protein
VERTQTNCRRPRLIEFGERDSESPYVLRLWHSQSSGAGEFLSVAYPQWEIVIALVAGKLDVLVRGAETEATKATVPADGSWLGIRFRSGTVMKGLDHKGIRDTSVALPTAGKDRIWLDGEVLEVPTFENVDDFVARLVRSGVLRCDPIVTAALAGKARGSDDLRTRQRCFAKSTGLSHQTITQIERAQHAAFMLREGWTISDTIAATGYSDQPHLTRSLKQLIGLTPGQLTSTEHAIQLSFIPRPERVNERD